MKNEPNKITGANSRPASPLDAGARFGSASCAPAFVSAAVAQFCRSAEWEGAGVCEFPKHEEHDGKGRRAKNVGQKMKTRFHIFCPPFFATTPDGDTMGSPNQAASGNGAVASRFHSAAHRRAVPALRR